MLNSYLLIFKMKLNLYILRHLHYLHEIISLIKFDLQTFIIYIYNLFFFYLYLYKKKCKNIKFNEYFS